MTLVKIGYAFWMFFFPLVFNLIRAYHFTLHAMANLCRCLNKGLQDFIEGNFCFFVILPFLFNLEKKFYQRKRGKSNLEDDKIFAKFGKTRCNKEKEKFKNGIKNA